MSYQNQIGFQRVSTAVEYGHKSKEIGRFINDTLSLFRGELSLHDILHGMPYKRLPDLRSAREQALITEQEAMERLNQNNKGRKGIIKAFTN